MDGASFVRAQGARWAPACVSAGSTQRRQMGATRRQLAVAGGVGGGTAEGASAATDTRQEAVRRQIADARQRLAAAQQRVSRAAASAAVAADGGSVALGRALTATQHHAPASGHSAASAALALARQEAVRADEAVAAVAAAVAGEAHRQQALLSKMQSQLAALSVADKGMPAALHAARRSSAASAGTAGAGASLSASSVSGAGRQMLVATGRVVAAAAVATLANQRRQARGAAAAAAPPAAAAAPARPWDPLGGLLQRQRQRQRQRSAGAAPSAAGARRRLSPLDLLLAPVAPLLRALAATNSRASQAGGSSNRYDMLLDMLGVLSEAPGVQVGHVVCGWGLSRHHVLMQSCSGWCKHRLFIQVAALHQHIGWHRW